MANTYKYRNNCDPNYTLLFNFNISVTFVYNKSLGKIYNLVFTKVSGKVNVYLSFLSFFFPLFFSVFFFFYSFLPSSRPLIFFFSSSFFSKTQGRTSLAAGQVLIDELDLLNRHGIDAADFVPPERSMGAIGG